MTIGSFSVVSVLETKSDSILLIDDLKGLAKRSPLVAFTMSVLLLSLAGLPPTLGFFGKLYLLTAAMNQGYYWLSIMAMVASAVGVYFYLRPIVTMYMNDGGTLSADPQQPSHPIRRTGDGPRDVVLRHIFITAFRFRQKLCF